jgi:hypothetical protein
MDNFKMDLRERERERMGWYGFEFTWLRIGTYKDSCEHGHETSVSIKS